VKRGHDGIWRTVGGIEVKNYQPPWAAPEAPKDETIHKLWIVHPKTATHDIVERECRIYVGPKCTWAEPLMPLRGAARGQKRYLLGAFAFYTRKQAERKKIIQLLALIKAQHMHQVADKAREARYQLEHFKATGEVK
jgi:CHAD domain-containing protein